MLDFIGQSFQCLGATIMIIALIALVIAFPLPSIAFFLLLIAFR